MKILNPLEVKSSRQKEVEKDLVRITSTKDALINVTTQLEDAEARFGVALSNQKLRWTREEQEATERISELQTEVKKLEKRKEELLMPIDVIKEKADNILKEAEAALLEANRRKSENDDLASILQERIDSCTTLRTDVDRREQEVSLKEISLRKQVEMTKDHARLLSYKWEEYFTTKEAQDKEVFNKKRELELIELSQKAKEDSIAEKESKLNSDRERIASERAALQAAYNEINNVKHSTI